MNALKFSLNNPHKIAGDMLYGSTKRPSYNTHTDQSDNHLLSSPKLSFESLKKCNLHGAEYWSARDLQPSLGYTEWRKFENAIKKAIESCKQSGNNPSYHFVGADKPILGGKGATQMVMDTTELAANLFRMTQTKERLKNERIQNQRDAITTHEMVGRKVRSTIE